MTLANTTYSIAINVKLYMHENGALLKTIVLIVRAIACRGAHANRQHAHQEETF